MYRGSQVSILSWRLEKFDIDIGPDLKTQPTDSTTPKRLWLRVSLHGHLLGSGMERPRSLSGFLTHSSTEKYGYVTFDSIVFGAGIFVFSPFGAFSD